MMSADYPDLTFIHAGGDGGPRPRTQIIIIHATDNTAPAANEASYARTRPDGVSAHYYVDGSETIQALPIGNIAYGALFHGNQVGVQYELCGRSNQLGAATISRAATQVARDCARYGIPVRKLTAAQVRAGERGICGHADVTFAWPEDGGDHTDPGASFPWSDFIKQIQAGGGTDMVDMERLAEQVDNLDKMMWMGVMGQEQEVPVSSGGLRNKLADRLDGIEADLTEIKGQTGVELTPEQMEQLKTELAEPIAELVADKLAGRLQS